ncbi:MAG: 1-phosphofructokinase [Lachnospiraceae bacterium]|nr:1-phosphofructokinase [Lachnospiraceae bacterium]
MIYTVTFNPCLDYYIRLSHFSEGELNRSTAEAIYPGGKGINVSIVLGNLGIGSRALGFLGGFSGQEIERRLKQHGSDTDFVWLKEGNSRINVKLQAEQETEINAAGPVIGKMEQDAFMKKIEQIQDGDILILSGNVPRSLSGNMYEKILTVISRKKIQVVADTTGEDLRMILGYHPFLVKPNHIELGELFGIKITEPEEAIHYAKKLQEEGAANVIVSMAEKGAVMVAQNKETYRMEAPAIKVCNSVGAGDSMVAGFVAEYERTKNLRQAFFMGVYTGSASAKTKWLCTRKEVEDLIAASPIRSRIE